MNLRDYVAIVSFINNAGIILPKPVMLTLRKSESKAKKDLYSIHKNYINNIQHKARFHKSRSR